MIRYFEEEVDLNEICFFKTEIEAYPNYDGQPFFLNCELMCADISTFGSASNGVDKVQLILIYFKLIFYYNNTFKSGR